jgi:predicted aldo/keto reductase-like oxidoreductase
MQYRKYGSTGIDVSVIGMGGMRFPQDDFEKSAQIIKNAYDAGINYFDTAPGYGKSEDVYGVALKEMQKTRKEKPFYVATKTFKSKPDEVRKELETSLERMNLEWIDFYHVWCVMTPRNLKERINDGVLDAFRKLKEEGLVKHICISTHMTGDEIAQTLKDYPFEGVLLGYSAMNFAYREAGISAAAELNKGVVVMNPLGGGIIPSYPEKFEFVKTQKDESVVDGALRFLLNDERISTLLVGISTQQELSDALEAFNGFKPISPEAIKKIRQSLKDSFNEMCTNCGYCNICPNKIPTPRLMEAYNHYILSEKPQNMLDRLKWHWALPINSDVFDKCIECGACERKCTQKLPIIERLNFIRDEVHKARKKAEEEKQEK